MSRILLAVPRSRVAEAIEAFFELRILHIHDHTEGRDGLSIGHPLEGASEASALLIRIRAMLATINLKQRKMDRPMTIAQVEEELDEKFDLIEKEVEDLGTNRDRLKAEIRNLEQDLESLEPFITLGLDLDLYQPYDNIVVLVGTATGNVGNALTGAGIPHELFTPEGGGHGGLFALFVEEDRDEEARMVLTNMSFTGKNIPEGEGDPREMHHTIKEGLAKLNGSLDDVRMGLKRIRKTYGDLLVSAEEHLSINVEKAESPLRFGSTDNALFIEGWIPTPEMDDLRRALTEAVGDAYHIEELEEVQVHEMPEAAEVANDGGEPIDDPPEHKVEESPPAPVLLRNHARVKPYEFLVKLVSLPHYKELDPSMVMFITFPIFFGMMLGDIAYGLILVIGGYIIIKKIKNQAIKYISEFVAAGGVCSMFFGVIYAEALGFELAGFPHGILWPHNLYFEALDIFWPINRLEDAMLMIKLCIWFGMFHILLGLAMGFVNELKGHGARKAFLAKGSWFFIIIGGYIVFSMYFGGTLDTGDPVFLVGLVMFLYGIVGLIAGEGVLAVLELPGILSNILSYTRLFAIGLSSIGIAMTFNTLGGMLWEGGVIGAIAGVLIGLMGHLLNIFLGVLGPSLHSLRLHYVEWMTKFYAGGGAEYTPFGRTRVYTEV
jgi:V/A-type H+-transporting ATPase subunit I